MPKQFCNAEQADTLKLIPTLAVLCLLSVAVLTQAGTAEFLPPPSATTIKCYSYDDNGNMLSIQLSIDPNIDSNIIFDGLEQ